MTRGLQTLLFALLLVLTGTTALAHCRPENRVWGFSEKPADFASQKSDKPIAASGENPGCGYDFASGVHKYLYCQNDPVDNDDPLGLYTTDEGNAIHDLISTDYLFEKATNYANVTFGKPAGIGTNPRLQPDILNKDAKTYAEIKPLTPDQVDAGYAQLGTYDRSLRRLGYKRELWPLGFPPFRIVFYNWSPYFYFNIDGLILYTRVDPRLLAIPISVNGMSKQALKQLAEKSVQQLATRGATSLTSVIGQRAIGVAVADEAALGAAEGTAATTAVMGGGAAP